MKFYGDIEHSESKGGGDASTYINFVLDHGSSFPAGTEGELFIIDSTSQGLAKGLYLYSLDAWTKLADSSELSPLASALASKVEAPYVNGQIAAAVNSAVATYGINHVDYPTLNRTLLGYRKVSDAVNSDLYENLSALSVLAYWMPIANSSATSVMGLSSPSTVGTAVARSMGSTSLMASTIRICYTSSKSKGASCGMRLATLQYWRGNAPKLGGFKMVFRFGIGDPYEIVEGGRMFVGLTAASAIGNVNPSTLINIVGVGCDAGSSNMSLMHNDGSGTATTIDLGANFPLDTTQEDLYELQLYSAPNGSTIVWKVNRLNTGHTTGGTITSNIPNNVTYMAPQLWRNSGTESKVVGIDFAAFISMLETP